MLSNIYYLSCRSLFVFLSLFIVSTVCSDIYEMYLNDSSGNAVQMSEYRNKVLLLTNVASECGFTDSHYKMYVELQKKFGPEDFLILAFPCNDFGSQEPNESKSVRSWARTHYKINFPVMQKLSFADRSLPPLWRQILDLSEYPSWNFWKYLIDRDGKFLDYYDNFAMEDVLEPAITAALRPREDL